MVAICCMHCILCVYVVNITKLIEATHINGYPYTIQYLTIYIEVTKTYLVSVLWLSKIFGTHTTYGKTTPITLYTYLLRKNNSHYIIHIPLMGEQLPLYYTHSTYWRTTPITIYTFYLRKNNSHYIKHIPFMKEHLLKNISHYIIHIPPTEEQPPLYYTHSTYGRTSAEEQLPIHYTHTPYGRSTPITLYTYPLWKDNSHYIISHKLIQYDLLCTTLVQFLLLSL